MHSAHAPITEAELRAFVRESLSARTSKPGVYMFEELGIERGAARVDLALVADGLEAFELKSDLDNFGRLHNQIHAYNRVFDRITIVTGETLGGAAMEVLPRWWGIWTVRRLKNGKLALRKLREAAENPRQDIQSLATLLWRDEAAQVLLDETGEDPPKRASRAHHRRDRGGALELGKLDQVAGTDWCGWIKCVPDRVHSKRGRDCGSI